MPRDAEAVEITTRRLDNGLQLVVAPQPQLHRAVLHAQLAVGARFESEADNGISHFLEHMLYRGTASHPSAHLQSVAFEKWGGALEATTASDVGTLSLTAPRDRLLALLPTFHEVFTAPLLSGIDIERGIVREELLESLDDEGRPIDANDLIRALAFEGHGLGLPIAGTLESLRGFDLPRLRAHHDRHYTAANTILVASGAIDAAAMLERGSELFATLPRGGPPESVTPAPQAGVRFHHVSHSASQTNLRVAFRAPGWDNPERAAMEVFVRLLDDGMSTRLYHRICDELGLCYDVSAGYESYADSGLLEFSAETSHNQVDRVLAEILELVQRLRDEGPTDEELETIAARYRWHADWMLDDAEALAEFVADSLRNGASTSLEVRCREIEAVTVEDVRALAARWCSAANLSVLVVGVQGRARRKELEQRVLRF